MARKQKARPDFEKALKVGDALAATALAQQREDARLRKAALAKAKRKVAISRSVTGSKGVRAKAPVVHETAGMLIAEGDSWFDYPFSDVLRDLRRYHGFDVESVAHRGDTVEDMAFGGDQLRDFAERVAKTLATGLKPQAILLSGGGNDVAGDEFTFLLNHATSSIAGLNESILAGVVDQRIRDAYVTILHAITAICVAHVGEPVPIIVHGYDYPVPDGRGFWGGWGPLPGPWLEPGFRRKGYAAMKERQRICVQLIDRFNDMLAKLAGSAPFAHVRHLDLRGTLSIGRDYEDWWDNELHPSGKGFKAVAAKFAKLI